MTDGPAAAADRLLLALDLTGRDVLAVGGGPVSARRVRGFLDAGARVRLVAPYACEDLSELAELGRIEWAERDWTAGDLDGVWLVHTATGDRDTDTAVREACEGRRIWCIDATDAAATRVASVATRRVSTPDGTISVGVHAGGDPQRARDLVSGFGDQLVAGEHDLRRRRARGGAGWVALVGGGPGDDGLLTGRGRTLLAAADVVVHDRLAPRRVIDALPDHVEVIDVGKTPGRHPIPQDQINQILVDQATAGRGVVRFKGGDPYVLGRGGEERLACEAAGVAVEVVPGVTSAIAVPAAAGIPVTHRGLATGFTVVTGHGDLPGLPTGADHTLVILMGVTQLPVTAATLIASGRPGDQLVAVIENGCTPAQRVITGTLADIADRCLAAAVGSPAVIVVGDVVRLAH